MTIHISPDEAWCLVYSSHRPTFFLRRRLLTPANRRRYGLPTVDSIAPGAAAVSRAALQASQAA
ncbi:MAG TPA: hypothetical protein VHZ02_16950 [Acidimicrobiales bacterium]|nr:hypothetical protein [Acidimicrobiales bacterium]